MRDRNKARETNISREGRQTFSSGVTKGETKKLDEGRRTTRSIQEPHEPLTSHRHVHINVSLVDLKNEGGLKSPKPSRQNQRRSGLSTSKTVPVEKSKSSQSSFSPRVNEASRSSEQDGSLNTKSRTRNFMKNGQTLAAAVASAISDDIENNVSRVTRRSLSVTNLIDDSILHTRSSRTRNSDFVSNSPPLKRLNRSLEKREKENVNSVKCGDCGKKTGRLTLSHHVGVPIWDTCESVRQTHSGNGQMSHKSCRVLLFDIKKQLGGVNRTSSYIVSGDNLNPLLNKNGTKVSVRKRFKCEIQSGSDGKFMQGGEPTKYRVSKLRIKRIQSVDDINIERHGPVEHKVMSRRSSGRLNKDKTAVSTRSGRIRRPTYKIRLYETSSLGSNSQNRRTSYRPSFPPDFYFHDESLVSDPEINILEENVPSLAKWDAEDPKSLLHVISELLALYRKHQVSLLNGVDYSRIYFECSSLVCQAQVLEEDVEVLIGTRNNKSRLLSGAVNFLIKLKADFSTLPPIVSNANPGENVAMLLVTFHSPEGIRITPQLHLAPSVEKALGSFQLPPFPPDGSCLMDDVPVVVEQLQDKVSNIDNCFGKKKEYFAALFYRLGKSVVEYDCVTFTRATFILEWRDFYFLVHFALPVQFPLDRPMLLFQYEYHITYNSPYQIWVDDYPYSPRWLHNEMVDRVYYHILDMQKCFKRSLFKAVIVLIFPFLLKEGYLYEQQRAKFIAQLRSRHVPITTDVYNLLQDHDNKIYGAMIQFLQDTNLTM